MADVDNGKILCESKPFCASSKFELVGLQVGGNLVRENLAGGTNFPETGGGSEKNVGIKSLADVDNGNFLCESNRALLEVEIFGLQASRKLVKENLARCFIPGGSVGGFEKVIGSDSLVDAEN